MFAQLAKSQQDMGILPVTGSDLRKIIKDGNTDLGNYMGEVICTVKQTGLKLAREVSIDVEELKDICLSMHNTCMTMENVLEEMKDTIARASVDKKAYKVSVLGEEISSNDQVVCDLNMITDRETEDTFLGGEKGEWLLTSAPEKGKPRSAGKDEESWMRIFDTPGTTPSSSKKGKGGKKVKKTDKGSKQTKGKKGKNTKSTLRRVDEEQTSNR